jgi:hypothetical protein
LDDDTFTRDDLIDIIQTNEVDAVFQDGTRVQLTGDIDVDERSGEVYVRILPSGEKDRYLILSEPELVLLEFEETTNGS